MSLLMYYLCPSLCPNKDIRIKINNMAQTEKDMETRKQSTLRAYTNHGKFGNL